MNTSPTTTPFFERIFSTPPWKSRAFIVFATPMFLLIIARMIGTQFIGTDTERYQQFGRIIGFSIAEVATWVFVPYLFFLGAERLIQRAHLTPIQTRWSLALGAIVAIIGVVLFVVIFPPTY